MRHKLIFLFLCYTFVAQAQYNSLFLPDNKVNANTATNVTNDSLNIEMVFVEGGIFDMGSNSDKNSDEYPAHSVTVSDFYIGKYEVTQRQYQAIMGTNPSKSNVGENYPVEYVCWDEAQSFIKELNKKTGKEYRLPTEAEWEYAARSGKKSRNYNYSGSNTVSDVAWLYDNSSSKTHSIGSKKANELGIYDMSGNVWEWCEDWHKRYPNNVDVNDYTGIYRIYRGGSLYKDATSCRVAYRAYATYRRRYTDIGFRLSLSVR